MRLSNAFNVFFLPLGFVGLSGCMDVRLVDKDGQAESGLQQAAVEVEDLELEGHVHPEDPKYKALFGSEVRTWRRVSAAPGTIISTLGQPFRLKAKEIEAPSLVVRSFSEEQAQKVDLKLPVDGGKMQIEAERARGVIYFELRGRDGRSGAEGSALDPKSKGEPGKPGLDGELRRVQVSSCSRPGSCSKKKCTRIPTSGEPGKEGPAGRKGGSGFRGGNTPELVVRIRDSKELRMDVLQREGRGGAGGNGGPGGPGGAGGKAGRVIYGKKATTFFPADCGGAKEGEAGPQGPRGPSGDPGAEGKRRPVWMWTPQGYRNL